jgi:formate/nitrite transporter FocA (FNT family)
MDKAGDEPERDEAPGAGSSSPHLDEAEQKQAAEHASPRALVIHEVVRQEGEEELRRPVSALLWSGLAAGLSMGFSFLGLALMQSLLPDEPWRRLVASLGYSLGFIITVLGRQQLFTESTLTAVLPLLVRRDGATLIALVRFWAAVLIANLVGTAIFAALLSPQGIFSPAVRQAMEEIATHSVSGEFWPTFVKAVLAGWLIAMMVWLLPSARSAKLLVILLLTYIVGVGEFSHIIAGSAESAFAVITGHATIGDYFLRFLAPTLMGNTIGGVALVALLNHAPLVPELQGGGAGEEA